MILLNNDHQDVYFDKELRRSAILMVASMLCLQTFFYTQDLHQSWHQLQKASSSSSSSSSSGSDKNRSKDKRAEEKEKQRLYRQRQIEISTISQHLQSLPHILINSLSYETDVPNLEMILWGISVQVFEDHHHRWLKRNQQIRSQQLEQQRAEEAKLRELHVRSTQIQAHSKNISTNHASASLLQSLSSTSSSSKALSSSLSSSISAAAEARAKATNSSRGRPTQDAKNVDGTGLSAASHLAYPSIVINTMWHNISLGTWPLQGTRV